MKARKDKGFCHQLRRYLRQYTATTSIHGLHYLTDKRSRIERAFWAIILVASLAGCSYMIYAILRKFDRSPVVVTFANRDTPIYKIPFPAVTICPESKCSRAKFNYTEMFDRFLQANETQSINETESKLFSYISLLCEDIPFIVLPTGNLTVENDFFDVINQLKPDRVVAICTFMGIDHLCEDFFVPIITDVGICYSFNILDRKELFRDHVYQYADFFHVENGSRSFDGECGFLEHSGIDTYPRRALMSGADNSLDIYFLHNHTNTDYLCNGVFQGFRVLIHNPLDVPRLSKHYFSVPLDNVVIAAIEPELVTTSEEVRNFKAEKRKCYLRTERPLKHFKIYTQSNCLFECITNYTLNKCGCVDFSMPRSNDTPICGSGNAHCLDEAQRELTIRELESKISGSIKTDYCDCKPLCTDLKYNVETSHGHFYWRDYFSAVRKTAYDDDYDDDEDNDKSFSVLSIYFKDEQFITLERHELYGISDLISNFGGLLGLFTGFSLISLAEIIYFLSLRIFCNRRLHGLWSEPSD